MDIRELDKYPEWKQTMFKNVRVGDFIKLFNDDFIPADSEPPTTDLFSYNAALSEMHLTSSTASSSSSNNNVDTNNTNNELSLAVNPTKKPLKLPFVDSELSKDLSDNADPARLRTLCLGYAEIDPQEYQNWDMEYKKASTALENREKEVAKVADKIESGAYGEENSAYQQMCNAVEKFFDNDQELQEIVKSNQVPPVTSVNPNPRSSVSHARQMSLTASMLSVTSNQSRTGGYALVIDGVALTHALKESFTIDVPELYQWGIKKRAYTMKIFLIFMFEGIYQSLIIFFIPYLAYSTGSTNTEGREPDQLEMGTTMAVACITMANLFTGFNAQCWTIKKLYPTLTLTRQTTRDSRKSVPSPRPITIAEEFYNDQFEICGSMTNMETGLTEPMRGYAFSQEEGSGRVMLSPQDSVDLSPSEETVNLSEKSEKSK
ncbi:13715_t:CDS:2 [Entrophospora sp. SA101]|nr:13715_t:CDS:2 [Entrophospora sp. SA101]